MKYILILLILAGCNSGGSGGAAATCTKHGVFDGLTNVLGGSYRKHLLTDDCTMGHEYIGAIGCSFTANFVDSGNDVDLTIIAVNTHCGSVVVGDKVSCTFDMPSNDIVDLVCPTFGINDTYYRQ